MRNSPIARARSLSWMSEKGRKAQMDTSIFDKVISRINTRSQKWDSLDTYRDGSVIPMWVADMDFPIDRHISDAIHLRAEHPIYGYVYDGNSIAESASRWMQVQHNWQVSPKDISFCPGIVPAISAAVQSFTEPGESVIIQSPVYYPFSGTIKACGRVPVCNPLTEKNNAYSVNFEDLEQKIEASKARLLILCNPHNPVGRVFTAEELSKIADICLRHNVFIFSDEIHSDLIMKGHRHIPIASLSKENSQHCMTGISPSKTFNLAGLQTAAVICENQERMNIFKTFLQKNAMNFPNTFGTEAFIAAYVHGEDYLHGLREYIGANYTFFKQFMAERLPMLRYSPLQGTYLLWIDFRSLKMTDQELDDFIIERAGLGLDSGHWFGEEGRGFMRMNIACPRKTLADALERLSNAVSELKEDKKDE